MYYFFFMNGKKLHLNCTWEIKEKGGGWSWKLRKTNSAAGNKLGPQHGTGKDG
jgi:hypothetical protein